MDVWTHNDLAYLPIAKNASSTFTDYFQKSGWQKTQLDLLDDTYKVFGHFQDPIDRHFKGVVEFMLGNNLVHLIDDPTWQKMFVHAAFDIHSMPVTWAVGPRYKNIKWIPIHRKVSTLSLTQRWLSANGYDCFLDTLVWKNQSSNYKLSLYHKLKDLYLTLDNNGSLSFFYDTDIIHWNSLWPYVDENNVSYRIH